MNNRRITLLRPSQMFDSMLDEFFNAPARVGRMLAEDIAINMSEDEANIYIEATVPGFDKKSIDISVEDGLFTISGSIEEKVEDSDSKKSYHIKEIKSESFTRSLVLPTRVDADNANAKFEKGMVLVTLPKLSDSKAKKISISE